MKGAGVKPRWTTDEDALVRAGAPELPGHTSAAVKMRRTTLGCVKYKKPHGRSWTPAEDAYLVDHRLSMTQTEMGHCLGRTRSAVSQRLQALGLVGDRTNRDWARRGEKSPNWKGGAHRSRCQTDEWRRKIRPAVIERDGGCVLCGDQGRIDVHHIVPWVETQDDSMINLVSLCPRHHKQTDSMIDRVLMQEQRWDEVRDLLSVRA